MSKVLRHRLAERYKFFPRAWKLSCSTQLKQNFDSGILTAIVSSITCITGTLQVPTFRSFCKVYKSLMRLQHVPETGFHPHNSLCQFYFTVSSITGLVLILGYSICLVTFLQQEREFVPEAQGMCGAKWFWSIGVGDQYLSYMLAFLQRYIAKPLKQISIMFQRLKWLSY